VKSSSVSNCKGCNASFSLLTRRHHCRACGDVFCKSCTSFEIGLHRDHYAEGVEKRKRVCASCYKALAGPRQSMERDADGYENEIAGPQPETEDSVSGELTSSRTVIFSASDAVLPPTTSPSEDDALTVEFSDANGDILRLVLEGGKINEYVNGELAVEGSDGFSIDAERRRYEVGAGAGSLRPEEDLGQLQSQLSRLFAAVGQEELRAASRELDIVALPGDMSEFSGPKWEAFREAYPAAATAFRGCAEALADPKVWDNEGELTLASIRYHCSRLPPPVLADAPGHRQVALFVDHWEEIRPRSYARLLAEIREAFANPLGLRGLAC